MNKTLVAGGRKSNVPLRTYLGTVTDVPGLYHGLCPELLGLKAMVRVEFFDAENVLNSLSP